ncbi:hypothetical protein INR49_008054 [Caranx melampygus]|nr:hypothetical protein INR49_008054 [Caranx melampygus]
MKMQVSSAVAPNTWEGAVSPTWRSRLGDGVLDRPVSQPARVAPVQTVLFPSPEELGERGHRGVLLLTYLPSSGEAQVVTTLGVLVGKHHTCVKEVIENLTSSQRSHEVTVGPPEASTVS